MVVSSERRLGQAKAKKKQDKEKAAKADDPKAGADVGKIVNLMAGDANRVGQLPIVPSNTRLTRTRSLKRSHRYTSFMEVRGLFGCFSSVVFLTVHQHRSKSSSRVSSYTSQYHFFYASLMLTFVP